LLIAVPTPTDTTGGRTAAFTGVRVSAKYERN
jgi:hypothetical protein